MSATPIATGPGPFDLTRPPQDSKEVGDDSWMYWESFWAPAEDAALALDGAAFQDAQGVMCSKKERAQELLKPG